MVKVCLVSCASLKKAGRAKACELYTSPLFRKASEVARKYYDKWFILSAKYGLLHPDQVVDPYDESLNNMSLYQRIKWADGVFRQIREEISLSDTITIFAGSRYREKLTDLMEDVGYRFEVPMLGLSIGYQLKWLNNYLADGRRLEYANNFYDLMRELEYGLGGARTLKACTGLLNWPNRGVYFFFEPAEYRTFDVRSPRVVRVGTHGVSIGSSSTLWERLRAHRGTKAGLGNHRSSVFRLHVGAALISRNGGTDPALNWGEGQNTSREIREREEGLERQVSEYIGRMSLLWLDINDEPGPDSDRAYVEKNCLGLLVGPKGPLDPSSKLWLGNWSPHPKIKASGMWNVDYTSYEYDPRFIEVLSKYVEITLGRSPRPERSIAPRDWYNADRRKCARGQIPLY